MTPIAYLPCDNGDLGLPIFKATENTSFSRESGLPTVAQMEQNGEARWSGLRRQPFVPLLSRARGQQESNKLGYTETLRCKAKLRELPAPAPLRVRSQPASLFPCSSQSRKCSVSAFF